MPEGDSLYRFAARLRTPLAGKEILRRASHGPGPVPQVAPIVGATCTGVRSHGKNVLIQLRQRPRPAGPPAHVRHVARLPAGRAVGTPRTRGAARPGSRRRRRRELQRAGDRTDRRARRSASTADREPRPGPARRCVRRGGAFGRFREPDAATACTIGDAIMDQRAMAGVGNIWKHETLFRCGLNPWLPPLRELDDGDVAASLIHDGATPPPRQRWQAERAST